MAIPLIYRLFFLYIEPVATLAGAYFAWFQPSFYLHLTDASSAPGILGLPLATHVGLRQLGNMYMCFALNEALVLRVTDDLRVWRTVLICLLIADFGHLYSCFPLGLRIYYDVMNWNAIDAGNIGFVYWGAFTRICFLLGLGLESSVAKPKKAVKSVKSKKTKTIKAPATPATPSTPSPLSPTEQEISDTTITTKTPKRSKRTKAKQPST